MHPLLQRQLKRLGLTENTLPNSAAAWQELLARISRSYTEADGERYLVERSLTLSSREMLQLYECQREESETRLEAERDRLKAVISSLGAGLCILDPDGCLVSLNPEAERLLGWKESELLGEPLLEMIAPHTQLSVLNLKATLEEEPALTSEDDTLQTLKSSDAQFICQDGSILPVSYVLNPILDGESLVGAVLVFFDISDRKRTQLQAERSLSLLQATFNATDAGIVALDRNGKVINFNQKFGEMWQIPESLLQTSNGQSALIFVLRQLQRPPQFMNTILRLSAEPKTPTYDIIEFKDSRIFEVYSHPSKVGDKIVGRVWSFRDITERKRVESALKNRVEFEQLITNLSTYFISLNPDEIDQGIEQALPKISSFIGVERGYIYLFSDSGNPTHQRKNLYQWSAPLSVTKAQYSPPEELSPSSSLLQLIQHRINSPSHQLYPTEIPWIFEQLNQLNSIHLAGDHLSEAAKVDLKFLEKFHAQNLEKNSVENLQYLTIIPLVYRKSVLGFLRFDALNSSYTWSSDTIALLKMVAEMFANTIERKRTEEVLRQTEAKYRSIFENAAEGIYQATPEGRYISANPALARIFGYDYPEELIQTLTDINTQLYVKPNRRAEFVAAMEANPIVSGFESQVYRKDGSMIWISENARLVRDPTGRVLCYEGTVEDITESRQAAEDLKQAKEAAVAANRAKSTFLANMSHELRTPLNAIIGYSEILTEESQESGYSDIVPDLKRICTAGRNLLSLINDILDISKIEAGRMDLYLESFNIRSLIESVLSTAQPLIDQNSNTLEVDCRENVTMQADVTKVRQILLNLLSNAAKFTTAGLIKLSIRPIELEGVNLPTSSFVEFQVSDTGIGMSPEQLEQLFQPFTQGDPSTTRRYGGTGLGLTISQRFCQMMGGLIEVDSQLDHGSVFTVTLPTEVQNNKPDLLNLDLISKTTSSNSATSDEKTSAQVLVIDDDPISRDLIMRSLERKGLQVETAATGEEGLSRAKQLRPDAITLDIMMPSMDGWSVLSALKADPELADIPVIVLSFVSNKSQGFALGASDYLLKPVDGKRLAALLHKYQNKRTTEHPHEVGSILVVEDDDTTRQMLREILQQDGWQVWEADNGSTAIQQLIQQTPTLILLDLVLPQINGFELINVVRTTSAWAKIPIIATTAKDLTPSERSQLKGCVEQVLQKGSYNSEELLRDIHALVNHSLNYLNQAGSPRQK